MENNSLATELLHEVKRSSKRNFVLFLITLILFFISNMAWLIAWNLPTDGLTATTETVNIDQTSNDSGTNYYNDGEFNYGDTTDN